MNPSTKQRAVGSAWALDRWSPVQKEAAMFYNLVSLAGVFVLVGVAWLMSADRRRMNVRLIVWGLALQMLFAVFIFTLPAGTGLFLFVNDVVVKVLDSASAGSRFVFGRLALPPGMVGDGGETSLGFMLAFQAFPTIVFFSALMSILYYYGIMTRVIQGFAWVFTRLLRVSGAESLCVASNIFVGIESALTIRPHLARMTPSELCVVLTAGMATVASSMMGLYVFCLQAQFPNIAAHLVSASVLSAPAAILMAKILLPESGQPETLGVSVAVSYTREGHVLEAVLNGAMAGAKLVVGIVALLLAVLSLLDLADALLAWVGGRVNGWMGWQGDWSIRALLGYLFYPFTLIIGVPPDDAVRMARIIGERTVATEVAGYQDLAAALASGSVVHKRSAIITAYALCGFAHVASMAIFVGGTAALAPERTRDLSRVAWRALVAATLACLLTAAVAGTFITDESVLFGRVPAPALTSPSP
jgi:CNT family concentrative nucleoside transporter